MEEKPENIDNYDKMIPEKQEEKHEEENSQLQNKGKPTVIVEQQP